jgi:hypothetical protein
MQGPLRLTADATILPAPQLPPLHVYKNKLRVIWWEIDAALPDIMYVVSPGVVTD